jgi:hypothetical protein
VAGAAGTAVAGAAAGGAVVGGTAVVGCAQAARAAAPETVKAALRKERLDMWRDITNYPPFHEKLNRILFDMLNSGDLTISASPPFACPLHSQSNELAIPKIQVVTWVL